ncbi:cyclin-B1-1 [Eurytemora carolleeae]|uniref:cyclin-B1-1 n=1 Tax=Eurytemora carolleeae TaxID=1294199 RepID=UPI000C764142|nr:cyclin-B1-1 [Eurytemora carolleeae]|eukprot:XP_023346213.1 cyclin-B1-1-like [Eurytemora affinis]
MATDRPDLVSVLLQSKTKMELLEPWELLNPLQMQTEIDINMRIALAEWMMEVCCDLNLEPEVFCLAVSCLDRFLCKVSLKRTQLQLLGVSCLLVAWKVRGEREVNIESLLKLTEDSIFKEEILECEMLVLTKLNWNLPSLVAVDFLPQILQKVDSKLSHQHLKDSAVSLIQNCYIHPSLAVRPPQLMSAAAVVSIIRPTIAKSDMAADTPPSSTSSSQSTSHSSSLPPSSYMSSSPPSSTSPTSSPPSSSYLSSSPCSSSFDSSSPSSFIEALKSPYITTSSDLPPYMTENPSLSDLSTSMIENPLSSDLPSYISEKLSSSELSSYMPKNTPTFGTTYSKPTNLNSVLLIQSSTKSQDIPVRGEGKHFIRFIGHLPNPRYIFILLQWNPDS